MHGKRNFCVPVLVVTSLSTSTVQDIYFLANNDVHYNLSGEHSLRTVSNLPGTVSMITLNYEQNYNKPHWFILAFAFYSAFTEKAQNARHAISHLETIMSQQISYSVSQRHYGYSLHNMGMSVVISTLQYIYRLRCICVVLIWIWLLCFLPLTVWCDHFYTKGKIWCIPCMFNTSAAPNCHNRFGQLEDLCQKIASNVITDHNSFQIWDFIS